MADKCSQCGLIHPAVLAGEKCPMSKDKTSAGESIDTGSFTSQVRNIIVSKIQAKKIKNPSKLFSAVLVSLFKFLDEYKEE